jgi:energy-coupling factor transport system permease protein
VGLLLLVTLFSGVPLRLWRRSVPALLAFAALVGLLSLFLPASPAPTAGLQRPPGEILLAPSQGHAPVERSGVPWEIGRWGPVALGPLSLGPVVVTRKSAELGLNASTLLFTVVHSANLLLLTTAPEALVWAINWWLRPFTWLGWPMDRLGFILLLSLRFLPLVQEELQNLLRALATRAVNLKSLGWKTGLGLVLAVGERLLANVLLRSEQGAEALMARGGHWLPPERLYHPKASSLLPTLVGSAALLLLLILRWRAGLS